MPAIMGSTSGATAGIDGEATLSEEQKITLATQLLSQCPPGEFADVLQGT